MRHFTRAATVIRRYAIIRLLHYMIFAIYMPLRAMICRLMRFIFAR